MAEVGGYDYELVTGQLPNDYICLICTFIAHEAQQASCCGKIFCKQCLQQLFRSNVHYSCPNCRGLLRGRCFPDRRAIREINQLQVKCSNADKGCVWTGKLREVAHHEKSNCFQECSNGCGARVRTGEMAMHFPECPLHIIPCPYCSQEGEQRTINGAHRDECPEISIPCPNTGCRVPVARKDLGSHRQICPKERISCPYANVGCTRVCLRDCMPSHEEDSVAVHLKLAMDKVEDREKQLGAQISFHNKSTTLKMDKFMQLKRAGMKWYSPGFYTSPGGYKMCLAVIPNGDQNIRGTHVSVYLCLLPGEYDDLLGWPLRGEFTIELLNQQSNEDHHERRICITDFDSTNSNSRVQNGHGNGLGISRFIDHSKFGTFFNKFLQNDTLFFQVTTVVLHSQTKPWLTSTS